MQNIPFYIPLTFVLVVLVSFFLLAKMTRFSKPVLFITAAWLLGQGLLTRSGFYTVTSGFPPRFALLLIPPTLLVIVFFLLRKGRALAAGLDLKTLTLLQTVRVPVEMVLYWLMLAKSVPQVMTFEGRNFDILCGLTAPILYYLVFVRKMFGRKTLLAWNLVCLLLLGNIVVTAVLSAPFTFQRFGFEQPAIALFYFPYVWLPGFVVPLALFSHLASLVRLSGPEAHDTTH